MKTQLNLDHILQQKQSAITNGEKWDCSTTGHALPIQNIRLSLETLFKNETANMIDQFREIERVSDAPMMLIADKKLKTPEGCSEIFDLVQLGFREFANEVDAFGYKNLYDYAQDNGIEKISHLSVAELLEVKDMDKATFIANMHGFVSLPAHYYAFLVYAVNVMLQQIIEQDEDED